MKLLALPFRVSPTEIVLVSSFNEDNIVVECESKEECDKLWNTIIGLRRSTNNNLQISKETLDFINSLKKAGIIVDEQSSKPNISIDIVGKGILAETLARKIKENDFTVNSNSNLKLFALDYWSPKKLREFDERAERERFEYIPIYVMFDIGVIGPHVKPNRTANYRSFEHQLSATFSWIFKVVKNGVDYIDYAQEIPPAYIDFLSSFTILMLRQLSLNQNLLLNKAVIIDFNRIFIDIVKIFRTQRIDDKLVRGEV